MLADIHFNNKEMTEMTAYCPESNRTYFLSVDSYARQLDIMKCPFAAELKAEVKKFLEE
jgi:hypothetical protein